MLKIAIVIHGVRSFGGSFEVGTEGIMGRENEGWGNGEKARAKREERR